MYKAMLAWKTEAHHKPLLLLGARQTGKTWLVEQFIGNEYAEHVTINLLDDSDVVQLYDSSLNAQEKYLALKALVGRDFEGSSKVLFIDEIQESESLISALKFFRERHPEVNIICSGSLLGVKLRRMKTSFPVGQIKTLTLYPMDIREFMLAFGEDALVKQIQQCFEQNEKLVLPLHNKALGYYMLYLCVGGMPEAVQSLVDANKDLTRFDAELADSILEAYFDDMNRYVSNASESLRIERLYHSIPSQLANTANKFQYAKVAHSARAKNYETALDWLEAAGLCLESTRVTRPQIPLRGNEQAGYFKLFLSDVGLLRSILKIPFATLLLQEEFDYRGAITENYIAQHMKAQALDLHYWSSENTAEVDFLMQTTDGIIPVEVKAGGNVRSKSLSLYREKYKPAYALRFSQKNFGLENGIRSLPLYAAFCLSHV
ncbi:MAG: ATP-binding protein [Coriobacteriales bacterium]|nr:ATP-binding protein [Coriobacteriales bacterium]